MKKNCLLELGNHLKHLIYLGTYSRACHLQLCMTGLRTAIDCVSIRKQSSIMHLIHTDSQVLWTDLLNYNHDLTKLLKQEEVMLLYSGLCYRTVCRKGLSSLKSRLKLA
jgi:hypothetical protein